MSKKNLIFGGLFAALGLLCLPTAWGLGVGINEAGLPLEGFIPFIVCLAILICGGIIVFQAVKDLLGKTPEAKMAQEPADIAVMNDEDHKRNLPLLLYTVGGLIALLLVWKFVNFYIAVALFSVVINKFVFKMTWVYTALFTAIIVAALYFGFGRGFQVRFNAV